MYVEESHCPIMDVETRNTDKQCRLVINNEKEKKEKEKH